MRWYKFDRTFWHYGTLGKGVPCVVLDGGIYWSKFMGVRRGFDNLSAAKNYALMGLTARPEHATLNPTKTQCLGGRDEPGGTNERRGIGGYGYQPE